jgi:carbonic anhydrase
MEMHLVHKDSNGVLGVLAVFLKSGAMHEELDKVLGAGNLPLVKGDTTDIAQFDLTDLLPGQLQTFRYEGSLTTPPCSEGVKWFVFTESMTVSPQQILDYQGIFSGEEFPEGNARPVRVTGTRGVSLSRPQWK